MIIETTHTDPVTDGTILVADGTSLGRVKTAGVTPIIADTGWTANSTAGDKTAILAAYANGIDGTITSLLNTAAAGSGTALAAMGAVVALLVKKTAALETALVAGKRPNA